MIIAALEYYHLHDLIINTYRNCRDLVLPHSSVLANAVKNTTKVPTITVKLDTLLHPLCFLILISNPCLSLHFNTKK